MLKIKSTLTNNVGKWIVFKHKTFWVVFQNIFQFQENLHPLGLQEKSMMSGQSSLPLAH